jgi:hypothetical protein
MTNAKGERRVFLRHLSSAFALAALPIEAFYSTVRAATADVSLPTFTVTLSHDETEDAAKAIAALAAIAAPPPVTAVVTAVMGVIRVIDKLGGDGGVEIIGSIFGPLFIFPAGKGLLGGLFKTLADVTQYLIKFQPDVILAKAGISLTERALGAKAGSVHANESTPKGEEAFLLVTNKDATISLYSYQGFFTADKDDRLIWANRKAIARDEKFTLIHNSDGTISLKSWLQFVSVEKQHPHGKNRFPVNCRGKSAGPWEEFELKFLGNGKVALLSRASGEYVSVAPGAIDVI